MANREASLELIVALTSCLTKGIFEFGFKMKNVLELPGSSTTCIT